MKASGNRSDDLPEAMRDGPQGEESAIGGEVSGTGAEAELALSDLVGDANGEVVIFNDSGLRTLAILTEAAVVADGQAEKHVTASGEDVSGFKYVTLDNGMTLYFQDGLELILESDRPRPATLRPRS